MRSNKEYLTFLLFLIAAFGLGALFFTVPTALDDYWYMNDVAKHGWLGCVKIHHLTDNSRLSDIIGAWIIQWPNWLLDIISTAAVAFTIRGMMKLSQTPNIIGLTIIASFYIFVVPWHDYLFTRMFTFNYIWSGAIMIGTIILFLRGVAISPLLAFVLGIISGSWHEGFSFPLFCGTLCCFAFHPKMIRNDRIALCIGLALGGMWLFMSPSRTSDDGYGSLVRFPFYVWRSLALHISTYIFLSLELLCLCVGKWRRDAMSPVIIIAIVTSLTGLCLHVLTSLPRTYTPGAIMEGVGIAFLVGKMLKGARTCLKNTLKWICLSIWIFIIVHLAVSFLAGMRFYNEEQYIQKEYQKVKNTDGIVFADVTGYHGTHWLTFGKPIQHLYTGYAHAILASRYYDGAMLKVIPPELKDYKSGMGRRLDGSAGGFVYKGWLVLPLETEPDSYILGAKFIYNSDCFYAEKLAYSFIGADLKPYLFVLAETDGLKAVDKV